MKGKQYKTHQGCHSTFANCYTIHSR